MPDSPVHECVHAFSKYVVDLSGRRMRQFSIPTAASSDARVRHAGSITVHTEAHRSDRAPQEGGDSACTRSTIIAPSPTANMLLTSARFDPFLKSEPNSVDMSWYTPISPHGIFAQSVVRCIICLLS